MKKRLEALKSRLGLQWKDLADALSISVPMLGCIRRGERNPSKNLLRRIEELEQNGLDNATCSNTSDTQDKDASKQTSHHEKDFQQEVLDRLSSIEQLLIKVLGRDDR